MAKPPKFNVASNNPDDYVSGMADDFTGTITKVRYVPWHYPGKDKYMLFGAVTIQPDEESGFQEFTEHYQAGWFNSNLPSNSGPEIPEDEREPAGATDYDFWMALAEGTDSIPEGEEENYEGLYVIGRGLGKETDWAQFGRSIAEAGFKGPWGPISCLEGLTCHFNRLPQTDSKGNARKSNVKSEGGDQRQYTVLVPTEVIGAAAAGKSTSASKPATSTAAKPASSSTATSSSAAADQNGFDERLALMIVGAVDEAGGRIAKAKLYAKIGDAFPERAEKAAGVKRLGEKEFWTSNGMVALAADGTVSLAG